MATDGIHLAKLTDSIITGSLCANGNAVFTSSVTGSLYQWQVNTGGGCVNITDNGNYSGSNVNSVHVDPPSGMLTHPRSNNNYKS